MKTSEKKKVLVLLGSPRRKGNSAVLAERIAAGAESAGATVETVFLHDLKISPCKSCYACQSPESKGCAVKDDHATDLWKNVASASLGDRETGCTGSPCLPRQNSR